MSDPAISNDLIRSSGKIRITVLELYQMVYVQKLSDAKIASIYNLNPRTVRALRRTCQYDSQFKIGTMDLPLSAVRELTQEGLTDDDIARKLNTTKTSVTSFKKRHGLITQEGWPPDRRDLVDMILSGLSRAHIASRYEVTIEELQDLIARYGLHSIQPDPAPTIREDDESSPVFLEIDFHSYVMSFFKGSVAYNPKVGYIKDGLPIKVRSLMTIMGLKEDDFQRK